MVSDAFRVEHVEACGTARHVNPFAVIRYGQRVKLIVLAVLKIASFAQAIPNTAEVGEAAFGEQSGRIGPFVGRRAPGFLKAESRYHARLRQYLTGALVGDGKNDRVRDSKRRMFRIGKTTTGKHRHVNKD